MPDRKRILLVDDDKDTCEMMSLMLAFTDDRYEVTSAGSADRALELVEDQPFDIYVLDSLLPDMSGIDLCTKIRRDDERTPILFYSGMSDNKYISRAKAAGATEYLVKPNDLDRFGEVVKKYLS